MNKTPSDFARDAWVKFSNELACVDDVFLKRAFTLVWRARGDADKAIANNPDMLKRLDGVDRFADEA